jgi:hypothetical protein
MIASDRFSSSRYSPPLNVSGWASHQLNIVVLQRGTHRARRRQVKPLVPIPSELHCNCGEEKLMKPPRISRAHGGVRGADLSRSSLLFEGPFGRMFRVVPPADFGSDEAANLSNFKALAAAMNGNDGSKDGSDAEESGIPSAYTYLGQFIDHDLTFDPASSLQKQNDPDALVDYRTPRFDLDNVYGRGPDDQPYMYADDGKTLIRGTPLTGAAQNSKATDLPRSSGGRAIIGDPRNDENIIVSQLQGLLHRFHNRVVADNPSWDFPRIQKEVRFHYQWMVLHDFLPTIVDHEVLKKVVPYFGSTSKAAEVHLEFFHPKDEPYMPLEFSAAAYRFGHSMVRPGYRLSETQGPLDLFVPGGGPDLRGFQPPPGSAAMDWHRFVDLEPMDDTPVVDNPDQSDPKNQNRLQLAYKIDTSLVNPLFNLPPRVATNPNILAERNLIRGWRMRLPSGQDVARAMGIKPLKDSEILIGKFTGDDTDIKGNVASFGDGSFKENCPLWVYILAETKHFTHKVDVKTKQGLIPIATPKLGSVGGRIVAEVIAGLLLKDSSSFVSLDPLWTPTRDIAPHGNRTISYAGADGSFRLRDLVRAALND